MFKKFLPVNTNVLVKLLPKKDMTKDGLYIPENTTANIQMAIVMCPGNFTDLKVDDCVAFPKYQGVALDDTYMAIKSEFILGVMGACND